MTQQISHLGIYSKEFKSDLKEIAHAHCKIVTIARRGKSLSDHWQMNGQRKSDVYIICYTHKHTRILFGHQKGNIVPLATIYMDLEGSETRKVRCVHAKLLQLCPTLCDPMNHSPPGSSVHGISRQEYWSGLSCPPPGDLPNPGIKFTSLLSPALASKFFTTSATWEAKKGR